MDATERRFAYGSNEIGGCACPAVRAGYNPLDDASCKIAEYYDFAVGKLGHRTADSILPEEFAREAWFHALHELRENAPYDIQDKNIEVALEIAEELGWSEE